MSLRGNDEMRESMEIYCSKKALLPFQKNSPPVESGGLLTVSFRNVSMQSYQTIGLKLALC